MANQLQFRWTYLQRKSWIHEAVLPTGEANDGSGVSPAVMSRILHAINEHLGENPTSWPGQELIASMSNNSRRTVIRGVQALERLSLLIVERQNIEGTTRHHNVYRIVWTELQMREPKRREQWLKVLFGVAPEPERSDMVTERSDMVTERSDMVTERSDTMSPEQLTNNPKNNPKNNSPPLHDASGATSGEWNVVVRALNDLGMSDWRGAVREARRRALTPADILQLVERWELLRAHQPHVTVGWLYRWINGKSQPPPSATEATLETRPRRSLSPKQRADQIYTRVVRSGRKNRVPEESIAAKLQQLLQREGLTEVAQEAGILPESLIQKEETCANDATR